MARPPARNTTRQREAGAASRAETRRRLLQAAGEEFTERGYHASTVSRIAARAGVTVQTLYLAWGSKRALLRAFMEASLSGDPETPYAEEMPHMLAQALDGTETDPRATIEHLVHLYRRVAERAAMGWHLYQEAAASDSEIAADWQALQHLRHHTFAEAIRRIPGESLRAHLTVQTAIDTAWAIASPETYDLLVRTEGYTLDEYEQWVATTLVSALLTPT